MLLHLAWPLAPALFAADETAASAGWLDALHHLLGTVGLIALVTTITVVVTLMLVRWSFIRPIHRTARWLEAQRLGSASAHPILAGGVFGPLWHELAHLLTSLASARAAAEEEARLREAGAADWTADRLRAHVASRIDGAPLFVVSNREPYMHTYARGNNSTGGIQCLVPASGLVTALEPILRACDGTWIAHGSGDADRETVDPHDRLRVPPLRPEYSLRRVWLTHEEEEGYYYGFSNEGLWPLCHIAHTRPLFRASDWHAYQRANQKFADAVIEEMDGSKSGLVLVQDYHFALLPQLIKRARPDARVGVFWHIPWPNPEAFGICPWQSEMLDGLLGADLIGFHTQAHCNNFLETVDRTFEARIEWEQFAVRRHGHLTSVKPFPISVATGGPAPAIDPRPVDVRRAELLKPFGVSADFLAVGVDRIDYTKGILERFAAIERFLEKWSRYVGRFTFVQIGAPSRTHIKRYQELVDSVAAEAERINARFATSHWKPIVLLSRHHDHAEIAPYYRAADLAFVTALHDGMNLVAKEFVMAREDADGVLVLSQFTGASRELQDALIVNPYDTEQMADTLRLALEMPTAERRQRMLRMRRIVSEHNVYRWAAQLIGDLMDVRMDPLTAPEAVPLGEAGLAHHQIHPGLVTVPSPNHPGWHAHLADQPGIEVGESAPN